MTEKPDIKGLFRMAVKSGCFRITIPEKPFAGQSVVLTAAGEPTKAGYREPLSNNELLYLAAVVPDLSKRRLDAFLRRGYHLTGDELKALSWNDIGVYAQDYLESQNTTPAKPARKTKEPTDQEKVAYQLTRVYGLKGQDAADMMNKEGRTNKKGGLIGQWDVSRWTASYAAWLELQGLPTEKTTPKAGKTLVNADAFKLGARTDGRKPPQKPTE